MPPFKQAVQSQPHATPRRPRMRAWPVLIFCSIAAAGILGTATLVRAAVGISATKTYAFIGGDGDGKADPGETLEYTVVVANSSGSDVTGVQFNDNPDANTTFVPGSITASPIAANDTFPQTVVGNVAIDSSLIAYSVTSNDFLGLNPAATISAYDATSANGGQVTMTTSGAGIGAFTYNPPPGFEGTDTFSYTISNVNGSNTATVSISVSGMVWFVNNNAAACTTLAAGCGRLSLPFSSLAAFNALNNGAGTNPAANDAIFIYESGTAYAGGVTLLSGQKLIGQDATATLSVITGLTPPSSSAAFPAMNTGGNATAVQNGAGNAVTLNQNNTIRGLTISGTSGAGMLGTGISALTVGSDVRLTGVAGADLDLSGAASGTISFGASVTNSSGRAISIQNRSGGSVDLAGAISDSGGTGVLLNSNTGAIITFSGGISLSTGANAAFTATNGGTIHVCDENPCNPAATGALVNTLTTTTGTALNIANTTIGANNLEFRSISANGASNGIVLTATGAAGGLAVKGDAGSANNSSGGTIQNTVGDAISLSSAQNITLDQMTIQSTGGSGINGTQVTNFAFTNGAISNAGNAGFESAIAFNGAGTGFGNNIAGSLTLTGNTLTNPFYSGLDVQSDAGTVTSATVSNNTISNPGFSGINFVGIGTALTAFNLARATIDQNNIASSGGNGIQVSIGNANASGPGATAGSLATGLDIIAITNNSISIDSIGTQAIAIANSGGNSASRTKTNFIIQCNGKNTGGCTAPTANPLTGSSIGTDILVGNNGYADMVGTIDNNSIDANHTANLGGGNGIGGGNGVAGAGNAWTPHLTLIVTNNTISDTDGNGILLVGRGTSGTANFKVANNTVAMPINAGGSARPGIRIDAGNSSSGDDAVCLNITGNTSAGSNGASGLGLRKQGTVATTNDFGIQNVSPATPTNADVQSFVNGLNAFGGGTDIINGSNFVQCAVPAIAVTHTNSHQAAAQRQAQASMIAYAPAPRPSSDSANGAAASSGGARGVLAPLPAPAQAGGATPRRHTSQPAPAQAGGIVNLNIGTLPAGKSITIKFRVTVNDPLTLGATQLANQGAISYDPAQTILTDDPAIGGASDATITVIDRPDTTVASINRASGNPSNNATVTWQVVLAAPIDGLTASNFNLVNSGLGGAPAITGVTPASGPPATTWNITASTGTGQGTLGLNIANDTGLSHDLTNAPFTGEVFTIDHIAPTTTSFTRQTPASSLTNADTLVFRVTFSEQVTGVGPADFAATGTTATVTSIGAGGPGGPYDVTVSGGDLASYNGVVGLNFSGAMSITDLAGNPLASSEPATDETYTLDNTAPAATSFTRQTPASSLTNADTLVFRVTFSEQVTGVGPADFAATGTTATVTSIGAGGPGGPYDVTVSGGDLASYNGVVGLNFSGAMSITDLAGNPLASSEPATDETYTLDNTAPAATSFTRHTPASSLTNADTLVFRVTFSEQVTGVGPADFAATGTTATVTSIGAGGPGGPYDVTVSGGDLASYNGVVGLNFSGAMSITDLAGNPAASSEPATDETYTLDNTGPAATIDQAAGQTDPTNSTSISFTVSFSEAVTGFDSAADIDLSASTAPGTLQAVITGGPAIYTVAVSGMTGDGTVVASIPAGAAIDGAANLSAASTSSDNSVSYDSTAPSATINQAAGQADPTASSPVSFTVVFSEPVADFATGDVALSGSAGATTAVVTGGPTTYTVAVSGMTGDGTVIANLAAGVAHDAAGNANLAATSTDNSVLYDTVAPSVTINQAAGQADPTNASPIGYIVVFSEAVSGFATGDVTLDSPFGALTGAVSEIAPMNGTTYAVAVTGMAGSGTITATIAPGAATDLAGQPNGASSSTDNTVSFDDLRPNTTIDSNPLNPTSSTSASFSFSGTDTGSGVAGFGCSLDGGGFSACTSPQNYSSLADGSHTFQVRASDSAGNVDASPASFTWVVDASAPATNITASPANPTNNSSASFSFTGADGSGVGIAGFGCSLDGGGFSACTSPQNYSSLADGSHTFQVRAIDAAGNIDPTPATFTWTIDTTAPTVALTSATSSSTNAAPILVSITFSEPVDIGTGVGDLSITNGSATTPVGSGTTYTFSLTPSGQGPVTAVYLAGSAFDAAGNPNLVSNTFSITYDTIAPSVTIEQAAAQPDPTSASPINFTVTFSEAVADFSGANVTLGGTAGATTALVTGSGTTYNVAVSGMTGSGTVIATIPANAAQDAAGNTSTAATSTDNTVAFVYDPVAPVVASIARADASPSNAASVQFTVTFSKNVTGVDTSDFRLTSSGVAGATITGVVGSGTTWTVTSATGSGDGTLRLDLIDDDTILDAANNPLGGTGASNGDFTSGEAYTIDKTAPQAGNLAAANITTSGGTTHSFTVVFSDNLAIDTASLDGSDIQVSGPGGFNQLAALVSVAPAGNGTPRTATYRISAPGGVWDTADNGSYTVALQANQVRDTTGNQAAGGVLGTFSVGASAPQHTTFLPFVLRPGAPDLVMSIGISPDKRSFKAGEPVVVSVTVTNQGDAPAGAFWVDLYINPSSPPTAANQIWNTRCGLTPCFGMAWPVPNGLAPGQSITLSSQSVPASYSAWPGWFAAGTSDLYGYADSYNPGVATGAVAERDETNNRAELHGLSVTGRNPGLARPRSVADRSARPAQPVK